MALAAAVAGRSCSGAPRGPEAAVRHLLEATKAGDRQAIHELLSPQTQGRLRERAGHASNLVGSSIRYSALDLISVNTTSEVPPVTAITTIEQIADHAVVEIVRGAERSRLSLVRVEGQWRIDMPDYGHGL
jgi:hypothetical protein